jgi:hypothetical protein
VCSHSEWQVRKRSGASVAALAGFRRRLRDHPADRTEPTSCSFALASCWHSQMIRL